MRKNILLFLLLTFSLFASDARLQNIPKATDYERDALKGDPDAMYNLAYTYHTELKDNQKAIYWYEKAYAKNRDVDSAINLGNLYAELQQYEKAIQWYKKTTDNKDATFNLALLYDEKLNDTNSAILYYTKAQNRCQDININNESYPNLKTYTYVLTPLFVGSSTLSTTR